MTSNRMPARMKAMRDELLRQELLRLVARDGVRWDPSVGVDGGFVNGAGQRFAGGLAVGRRRVSEAEVLVGLHQLRHAGLITVDGRQVRPTDAGRARLAEWAEQQAGAR